MKDSISGVVRTPPKSEMIVLISAIAAYDLVVAKSLAPLEGPAEEGNCPGQPGVADLSSADQGAGAAQRLSVLVVEPELERRPTLHAVWPVLGREQRLGDVDRGAVGAAEHRPDRLLAVSVGTLRAHSAEGKQATVGKDNADRSPQNRPWLAHPLLLCQAATAICGVSLPL